MAKTIEEINEKISKKRVVVVTAEEMIDIVEEKGIKKAAEYVDVVTTGTFGPMCSSGALLNVGHASPRMKIRKAYLNGVEAYSGIGAVDMYIGATEIPDDDAANSVYPGEFKYGGGHVIEDLIAGKDIILKASSYGTDCYPNKKVKTRINIRDLNNAVLLNPRNAYQNYNVAVNQKSQKSIYTYLGMLLPDMGNANYCSAGQLSPLLNDPYYKTIGIGTRIFLGGAEGYVIYHGTQHCPDVERSKNGVPRTGSATISVIGNMKNMSWEYIRGVSIRGYGVSLSVGIGIPIPVLNEDMAMYTSVRDRDIYAPVIDYSRNYPYNEGKPLAYVNYEELRSGIIEIKGQRIRTGSMSSYQKARQISMELKKWINNARFFLSKPVELLPGVESGIKFKMMKYRDL